MKIPSNINVNDIVKWSDSVLSDVCNGTVTQIKKNNIVVENDGYSYLLSKSKDFAIFEITGGKIPELDAFFI